MAKREFSVLLLTGLLLLGAGYNAKTSGPDWRALYKKNSKKKMTAKRILFGVFDCLS